MMIGEYQIVEELSRNHMAITYKAIDGHGVFVIVKALREEHVSVNALARFKKEYELACQLNSELTAKPLLFGQDGNVYYVVFEYIEGVSLATYLRSCETIQTNEVLVECIGIAMKIVEVLMFIHDNGVIHKDLSPSNIIINPSTKKVRVIDFGLAEKSNLSTHTSSTVFSVDGTLAYISPEQTGRLNRGVDQRSDFYSLGIILYEMLAGEFPYRASNTREWIHCHLAHRPSSVNSVNAFIPNYLSDVVMRLMEKSPDKRYQSSYGIISDLEACLTMVRSHVKQAPFIVGLNDLVNEFRSPIKLYARETERKALETVFDLSSQGSIQLGLISGASGVGKSALVNDMVSYVLEKNGRFITGNFEKFHETKPYSAIIDAFKKLVDQLLSEQKSELIKLKSEILRVLKGNVQLMIDVIPQLALITGEQERPSDVPQHETQNRFIITFLRLITLFAKKEAPLVLFLDDAQWCDSASLEIIKTLQRSKSIEALLLIVAYRDNEIPIDSPFLEVVNVWKQSEETLVEIHLTSLSSTSVYELVKDTYFCNDEDCRRLTDLVLLKTNGNPYYVIEFLSSLYANKQAVFNNNSGLWILDFKSIIKAKVTENVVELISDRFMLLSPDLQDVLHYASCMGMEFCLLHLALVCGKTTSEIKDQLQFAIDARMISHLSTEELGVREIYQFLHNKTQQAVYSHISKHDLIQKHLHIGQVLLEYLPKEEQDKELFAILEHFYHATSNLKQSQKGEIAILSLRAANIAMSSGAYVIAFRHASEGLQLLSPQSWGESLQLSLQLHLVGAETAAFCGDYLRMDELLSLVLFYGDDIEIIAKAHRIRISALVSQNKPQMAIDESFVLLALLNVSLPQKPSVFRVMASFANTSRLLKKQPVNSLDQLPLMTDQNTLIAMDVLGALISILYRVNPYLLAIVVFKLVRLSLKRGIAPISPVGFVTYGLLLNALFKRTDKAYELGQKGMELFERMPDKKHWSQAFYIFNVGLRVWKEPITIILEDFLVCFEKSREGGDFETMQSSAVAWVNHAFRSGGELTYILEKCQSFVDALSPYHQKIAISQLSVAQQTMINLVEPTNQSQLLKGRFYNEDEMIPYHKDDKDDTSLFIIYCNKITLAYTFEKYELALLYLNESQQYLKAANGIIMGPIYLFYKALTLLATPAKGFLKDKQALREAKRICKLLKSHAHFAPSNFLAKYLLLKAELCRKKQAFNQGVPYYEQAIEVASDTSDIEMEALVREHYGRFLMNLGVEEGAKYQFARSMKLFELRGSKAKCDQMQLKYFESSSSGNYLNTYNEVNGTGSGMFKTSLNIDSSIDLSTVLDAAKAISGEVVLTRLIKKTMRIIMECAGAQRGVLFLKSSDDEVLSMEALGFVHDEGINVSMLRNDYWEDYVPASIVRFTERTQELVIIGNAQQESRFCKDAYVVDYKVLSVIAIPIIHQSKLGGILYLENNLSANVFHNKRVSLLAILSAQLAVSLENARLFNSLDQKVKDRTQEISEKNIKLLHQKLELESISQKLKELNSTKDRFFSIIAHDLRGPLGTSASLLEVMLADFDEFSKEEMKGFINNLKLSTDQTFRLLDDLLLWAKSQRNEIILHSKLHNVSTFINENILLIRPIAEKKNVTVDVVFDADHTVAFDGDMISTVVRNVLNNSLKYVHVNGEILISVSLDDDNLKISIKDNGIGMPEFVRRKLFTVGEKVTSQLGTKGEKGSGLGLILCYEFISQHNGKIWVESEPSVGTEVTFTIPASSQVME